MGYYKQGCDVFLAFKEDIGHAVNVACKNHNADEGIALVIAANIVRREMLQTKFQILGSFSPDCHYSSVTNVNNQSNYLLSQATLSLSLHLLKTAILLAILVYAT